MRLGAVKYIVPFCFALNPALVAQDSLGNVLLALGLAVVGVYAMGSAFGGWMPLIERRLGLVVRIVAFAAGVCLLLPDRMTSFIGLAVVAVVAVFLRLRGDGEVTPKPTVAEVPAAADAPA